MLKTCDVLQGSILRINLIIIYTACNYYLYNLWLHYLLQSHGASRHFYADDAQIHFKLTDRNHDEIETPRFMNEIRAWINNQKFNNR